MILDTLVLALGLGLLLGGGQLLVRGASALARAFGISPLTIGLTVVAFGPSAPELSTNITAAWSGNGELSFGNIMGSNLANIGLILAATALIRPFEVKRQIVTREIPMMLLATAAALVLALDEPLSGQPNAYGRADGLILLLIFSVFVYYTWNEVQRERTAGPESKPARAEQRRSRKKSLLWVGLGLVGLVIGAEITVASSVSLAAGFGISEAVIGLTLVAVGTSLPELATSLVALARRQTEVAIGNVVGSNILNLLLVGGLTATTIPIPIPPDGIYHLLAVGLLSLLLLLFSLDRRGALIRAEAGALLVLYLAYIGMRTIGG